MLNSWEPGKITEPQGCRQPQVLFGVRTLFGPVYFAAESLDSFLSSAQSSRRSVGGNCSKHRSKLPEVGRWTDGGRMLLVSFIAAIVLGDQLGPSRTST